jgi:hypothetical protein
MEIEDGVMLAVAGPLPLLFSGASDGEVVIKTWVAEASSRLVTFAYEMRLAADGKRSGDPPRFLKRVEAVPDAGEISREILLTPAGAEPAGSVNSARSTPAPPTAMPTIRKGSRISHTIG